MNAIMLIIVNTLLCLGIYKGIEFINNEFLAKNLINEKNQYENFFKAEDKKKRFIRRALKANRSYFLKKADLRSPVGISDAFYSLMKEYTAVKLIDIKEAEPIAVKSGKVLTLNFTENTQDPIKHLIQTAFTVRVFGTFSDVHPFLVKLLETQKGLFWSGMRISTQNYPKLVFTLDFY